VVREPVFNEPKIGRREFLDHVDDHSELVQLAPQLSREPQGEESRQTAHRLQPVASR
jgi:hypothetical protein